MQTPGERTDLMDVQKSMARFGGDSETFMRIMRSFVESVRSLLDVIKGVTPDNIANYAITVHGLKGSSRSICADTVGDMAEALEKAAKTGDFDFIRARNPELIETVDELIAYINDIVDKMSANNSRAKKDMPDRGALASLVAACKKYNMDGVDAAMEEIESFEYESGGELAGWLRTNVDNMNFRLIIEKLSYLNGTVEE